MPTQTKNSRPAVTATAVMLTPDLTVSQACRRILANCLSHLTGNRDAVANGLDIEALHQMRVASRRLRAALALFVPAREGVTAGLASELRWLARTLGNARDWDVFVSETLPQLESHLDGPEEREVFRLNAENLQMAARQAARRAVRSRRYARFARQLRQWLKDEGWRAGHSTPLFWNARVCEYSSQFLSKRQQRVQRLAGKPSSLSEIQRHALRISAKKLRYAAEFFASLYSASHVRPYLKRLTALQEILGTLNDAVVTQRLLEELEKTAVSISPALLSRLEKIKRRGAKKQLKDLPKTWRRFKQTTPFWESAAD